MPRAPARRPRPPARGCSDRTRAPRPRGRQAPREAPGGAWKCRKGRPARPATLGDRVSTILVHASLTDPLVNFATDVVDKLGLAGVFVLMVLESACIPIPSEATMLFAGFNVSEGEYSLL